ncbi:hypothetical protein [Endobacter medicaginis]|uniref:hypothetical protein n=1 Tax=Endobacter medicaginis TaxID=1181271 RepID=UPI001C3FF918|nr:hypothetical protein [Endobacter medicaginis]
MVLVVVRKMLGPAIVLALSVTAARAQPAGPADARIQQILSVLRERPDEASPSCLDSLKEMHATEDALQSATSRGKSSDIELANDVLETDYQNVMQVCGVDATRVCHVPQDGKLGQACASLRRGN